MWGVREMMQYVERVKNMRERRGRLKKKKMNVSTLMEWLLKISNSSFVQGGPKVPPPPVADKLLQFGRVTRLSDHPIQEENLVKWKDFNKNG